MSVLSAAWRKSSRSSQNGNCVEVRRVESAVNVRDTKDRSGPMLTFTSTAWASFVAGVHSGEFDRG